MIKCSLCDKMAVWFYMPDGEAGDRYFCDGHISRGCSCNLTEEGEYETDELGRDFPCIEFSFNENGFDESD